MRSAASTNYFDKLLIKEKAVQRLLEYITFFVAVVLLQALLFDNLVLTRYVVPLYYVAFILLLPVNIGRLSLLIFGALLGMVMDALMGVAGLNVIATTAVAFARPLVMSISMGNDTQHEKIPFGGAIDDKAFLLYTTLLVGLHQTIFFGFESLGSHFFFTVAKIVCSTLTTVVLVWITAGLFRRITK